MHIFEGRVPGIAHDRKDRLESGMQTHVFASVRLRIGLQEAFVGLYLSRQQERHLENTRALAKVFTDAFLFGKRIGHACLTSTKISAESPAGRTMTASPTAVRYG